MNRRIFRIWMVTLMITVSALSPDTIWGQEFNAGVFGGVTASQVDGDSYWGYNKLGLTAGAFVNREINYQIYWQMELKYVSRGVYKGPTDPDPSLYRSTYRYLELPLSVFYLFDQRIQVEAGVSPEVLIRAHFSDQDGLLDPASYPDNRRVGVSVFAGIHYWLNESLGAGIRFTYSAIPFRDPREWNHPRYRGYYHDVICLSLSYRILKP